MFLDGEKVHSSIIKIPNECFGNSEEKFWPDYWWKLDEESGTTVYDSGRIGGFNGTNTNATVNQIGKQGKCYDFNGTSAYIDCGTGPKPTNYISMAAWVSINVLRTEYNNIIDHHNGYELQERNDGHMRTYICLSTSGWVPAVGVTTLVDNTWYYVVGTFNSDTGAIRIYLDGKLDGEVTGYTGQTIAYSGTDKTFIGALNTGADRRTDGKIDDVRIWERELSSHEISQLYEHVSNYYLPQQTISIGKVQCEKGDSEICYLLAVILDNKINYIESQKYYKKSCNLGNSTGCEYVQ